MKERLYVWQLMVGTGFVLLIIGLILIFTPPGVGDRDPFLIEFFEAKIESTEMGLALIVLGLSCFLIGRKDLADLRTVQTVQGDLQKTSHLAARLVADRVEQTYNALPDRGADLVLLHALDADDTRKELKDIQNGDTPVRDIRKTIYQAERGMELLQALEKEGYSI